MRLCSLPLVLALLAACTPSTDPSRTASGSGGSIAENGGDFLACKSAAGSHFAGDFALDYVLSYDENAGLTQDPDEATFDELTARTTRIIEAKLPELSESWHGYLSLLESANDAGARVWRGSGSGLSDLKDEQIARDLDANCKALRAGALVPDLKQMVRRSYFIDGAGLKIFYEYDAVAFDAAKTHNPLQLSYLVVHEWLWDFVRDPYANRWINRLIHSKRVDTMPAAAVRDVLRSYGVTTDEAGQVGHPSSEEAQLAQVVAGAPNCDATHRMAVAFPGEAARFTVQPGKSVSFTAVTPRFGDVWPNGICGVALVQGRRAVGSHESSVSVEIRRGGAAVVRSLAASPSVIEQDLATGFCVDAACDDHAGELGFFYKPGEVGKSTWQLTASVPAAASDSVEVSYPYLVFYAQRAPLVP